MINDGGPAFPSHGTMGEVEQEGMTLRDYFAAQAMTGLLANIETGRVLAHDLAVSGRHFNQEVAVVAYEQADAMLAERAKVKA